MSMERMRGECLVERCPIPAALPPVTAGPPRVEQRAGFVRRGRVARQNGLAAAALSLWGVASVAVAQVAPPNNQCANAITIGLGSTPFSTIGATTDGPPLPDGCDKGFGLSFVNDIWFLHTARFSGTLEVSTCGAATFDTRLASYLDVGSCQGLDLVACNDDGAGCPLFTSIMQMPVERGATYLIRLGAFVGSGTGTLTLTDDLSDICVPSDHDCFEVGLPGCDDVACCTAVCEIDPFCCVAAWDFVCVAIATLICDGCGDPDAGDCCTANPTAGCADAGCCAAICGVDPFCCEVAWDALCADQAIGSASCSCEVEEVCPGDGDCFVPHGTPGCDDASCCIVVCAEDPFCCRVAWDLLCVDAARTVCDEAPPCPGDITGDGVVGGADLGVLLGAWGAAGGPADVNGDGIVDGADLSILLNAWGPCPR